MPTTHPLRPVPDIFTVEPPPDYNSDDSPPPYHCLHHQVSAALSNDISSPYHFHLSTRQSSRTTVRYQRPLLSRIALERIASLRAEDDFHVLQQAIIEHATTSSGWTDIEASERESVSEADGPSCGRVVRWILFFVVITVGVVGLLWGLKKHGDMH